MGNYRFLFSAKWIASFFLCILLSLLCLYLADWQMGRKEALDQKNQLILDNFDAAPLPLADLPTAFTEVHPEKQWQPISMTGTYLSQNQLLVRNRPYKGLNGYEVLVPFKLDQGQVILINRGWVQAGFGDASKPASEVPAPPSGRVELTARIHQGEHDNGKDAPAGQISSIDLPEIAEKTGLPVADAAYGLLASEKPAPASAPTVMDKPDLDTGPNLSYSVQWYVFSIMAYFIYFWSARQKVRNDELDAQVAAELDQYYRAFYDADGNYIGQEDEEIVLRKMEMVDDMPSHMKSIVRPKIKRKKSASFSDEDIEDAYLDSLENN